MTFALQPNRLSRLDNDTAAPTTIATGPGGWLEAEVLPDPCPTDATASPALFTTTGGSGAFTITAEPCCTWRIDTSALPGLTFTTSSGTARHGALLARTVATARRGVLRSAAARSTIEQTSRWLNIDEPGPIAQPALHVRGWAIEVSAPPSTVSPAPATVASVHAWAWPTSGAAPIFVGATSASRPRPDIAAVYGSAYGAAEFLLPVSGLPAGTYTIVVYAFRARLGTLTQGRGSSSPCCPARGSRSTRWGPASRGISSSAAGPRTCPPPYGPGVDAVHVWAYPASGAPPVWVGAAAYGRRARRHRRALRGVLPAVRIPVVRVAGPGQLHAGRCSRTRR